MRRSLAAFTVAALALPALAFAAACRDATASLPVQQETMPSAYGAGVVARLNCTGSTTALTLDCRDADAPRPGGPSGAIFGGGYVKLKSYNPVYDTTSLIFSFDVSLQNLLPTEPIGTPDGSTAVGSKVFYHESPQVTEYYNAGDTGSVTVKNAEGYARFTKDHQPYHFYPQILMPQDVSPLKHWELRMPRSVKTFSFLLYVFTARPGEANVPNQAPHGTPAWMFDSVHVVDNLPGMSGRYVRDVMTVVFRPDATLDERQAAIDWVNGTVVGGYSFPGADGIYYVKVAGDSTAYPLLNARAKLEALPQVLGATPTFLDPADETVNYTLPADSAGYTNWRLNPAVADSMNWGLEVIAAPDAWGCSTGDPNLHVAVVDNGFHLPENPDLAANVAESYHVYHWADRTIAHGTNVSSVLAARGNNHSGMTGVMWNAHLAIYEHATGVDGLPLMAFNPVDSIYEPSSPFTNARILEAALRGARIINVSAGMRHDAKALQRIRANTPFAADESHTANFAHSLEPG